MIGAIQVLAILALLVVIGQWASLVKAQHTREKHHGRYDHRQN